MRKIKRAAWVVAAIVASRISATKNQMERSDNFCLRVFRRSANWPTSQTRNRLDYGHDERYYLREAYR